MTNLKKWTPSEFQDYFLHLKLMVTDYLHDAFVTLT